LYEEPVREEFHMAKEKVVIGLCVASLIWMIGLLVLGLITEPAMYVVFNFVVDKLAGVPWYVYPPIVLLFSAAFLEKYWR
jgi:hypothetical protein